MKVDNLTNEANVTQFGDLQDGIARNWNPNNLLGMATLTFKCADSSVEPDELRARVSAFVTVGLRLMNLKLYGPEGSYGHKKNKVVTSIAKGRTKSALRVRVLLEVPEQIDAHDFVRVFYDVMVELSEHGKDVATFTRITCEVLNWAECLCRAADVNWDTFDSANVQIA